MTRKEMIGASILAALLGFATLPAMAAPADAGDAGYAMPGLMLDAALPVAREASEGPRGGDNEKPGDRQRRKGKRK